MANKEIKFLEAGKCCFCGKLVEVKPLEYDMEDLVKLISCPHCGANYKEWHIVTHVLNSIDFNDGDWTDVEELTIGTVVACNEE